jgi:hypothetical protein
MTECTQYFSPRTSLAAVGVYMGEEGIWQVIEQTVKIDQKVLKHTPTDKLLDCLINMLAGGDGVVEINTRVRPDRALQAAFGRRDCADQSVVSTTLNACTEETVGQMRTALATIYQQHSQGYTHDYGTDYPVLDVDMTGMPAGRQGEGVTKGYFAKHPHQRGRQLGRVCATRYDEVVVDRLYTGKRPLDSALPELIQAAEAVLRLDTSRRARTIIRADRGGGTEDDSNGLLERGYALLVKTHSWRRAQKLAASVTAWVVDPNDPGREAGWVPSPFSYVAPTQQVAVRTRKANGEGSYAVLVSNLSSDALGQLVSTTDPLWAVVYAYDLRGGGAETQNRNDKQGLGLTKRNKASFAAQEMLALLAQLAHNLAIWTRNHLAKTAPALQHFGILRRVRDVLQIPGQVQLDSHGHVVQITLNRLHPFARIFVQTFSSFLARDDLSLILRQI